MPYVDIRVHLSVESEPDGWTGYDIERLERIGDSGDIKSEAMFGLGETLVQGDWLWTDFPTIFMDTLEG